MKLSLNHLNSTLIVWEKYKNVLSGISFSTGISLIPKISEHLLKSSSRTAPALSYSWSENILFIDGWTMKARWGWFSRISLIWAGVRGALRSQTLLSYRLIPIKYLFSISNDITLMDGFESANWIQNYSTIKIIKYTLPKNIFYAFGQN